MRRVFEMKGGGHVPDADLEEFTVAPEMGETCWLLIEKKWSAWNSICPHSTLSGQYEL